MTLLRVRDALLPARRCSRGLQSTLPAQCLAWSTVSRSFAQGVHSGAGLRGSVLHCSDPHSLRRTRSNALAISFSGKALSSTTSRTLCKAVATEVTEVSSDAVVEQPQPLAWKASLDFKYVRDNVDEVKANAEARASDADVDRVATLYDQFLEIKAKSDELRAERNANAKKMKGKLEQALREQYIEEGKALKDRLATLEAQETAIETELQRAGQRIPNFSHPDVPLGGEENAALRKEVGAKPEHSFPLKDHLELAEALKMVNFDAASEVSGTKFYYLTGAGALLELALVNWAMQRVVGAGFTPHCTPDLVRSSVLEKCGFQPRMSNTQVYSVENSDLCLVGTAEIPLGGLHMDKILTEADLPIKMAAFGHCFRTEAGAAGAAQKGLYRVHQFSKVELFVLCTPEQSEAMHEELILLEEEMFGSLGLHFKTLDMPTHDLGAPAYRKYDVEAWMPGMGRYGEISSASNCTDYQARRLNIRYRPKADGAAEDGEKGKGKGKGKKSKVPTKFVHTLNATACAVPRLILAILENFQQEDGSVVIPEPLRPYMGGMEVIPPPSN